jgi:putative ABC transport system permease protein
MIGNHLKIALRTLLKRKGYTALNVFGLTIGMTSCLLIFHYVSFEKSFDKFQKRAFDIVRIRLDSYQQGKLAWKSATVYPAIAPTLKKGFPEVENFCRLHDANMNFTNDRNNVKFSETKGYFADASALDMFNIELIKGDRKEALTGPDKLVISEKMAQKYFGNDEAYGKTLSIKDAGRVQTYLVSGVFKNYPPNSHLIIEYLASYATLGKIIRGYGDTSNATETSWGWYDFYSYVQLKPGTDLKAFSSKLPAFADRHMNNLEWYKTNNTKNVLSVIPLTDIHLRSNVNQEAEVNGNGQAVGFLFLVAIFIIGIAWINYINLATARSVERAREVGVRKVLGALRFELIRQFLIESVLLNVFSFIVSLGLFALLVGPFDNFVSNNGLGTHVLSSYYWLFFLLLFAVGTMLSGIYPSLVLSSFKPIALLKGVFSHTAKGIQLRKALIVLQFVTSVVLIAGTIVVFQQVQYMRNQDLGVNIRQTLVLDGATSLSDSMYLSSFEAFKNELKQQGGIKSVSGGSSVMGNEIYWTSGVRKLNPASASAVTLYHVGVDYDFLPAFDIKFVAGRNFSRDFKTDERGAILNQKAIELFGYKTPEEAVGAKLARGRDTLTVVGVISNYHHQGLQKPIDPTIVLLVPDARRYYALKTETADIQKTIASVEKVWSRHFPSDPLNYFFLDESFNRQYRADIMFGKVFGGFAFLAIIIACFGLLGLTAYNVAQRTKEIGIRKVLGASVNSILLLLSKDFIRLIVVSLIIAIPLGWYLMDMWLQDFAYRIEIAWWVFAVAGILALAISLFIISLQAAKSATENPVKSLRTE